MVNFILCIFYHNYKYIICKCSRNKLRIWQGDGCHSEQFSWGGPPYEGDIQKSREEMGNKFGASVQTECSRNESNKEKEFQATFKALKVAGIGWKVGLGEKNPELPEELSQ